MNCSLKFYFYTNARTNVGCIHNNKDNNCEFNTFNDFDFIFNVLYLHIDNIRIYIGYGNLFLLF
jgi:hypothetical protein